MKSLQVEKKKKRDKPAANGTDTGVDEQARKQPDAFKSQSHVDQRLMETVNVKKPSLSTNSASVPYTSLLYPPLPQWPLLPPQQGQIPNQSTQPHLQVGSIQPQPLQGQQTSGCQQNNMQQGNQQLPYWSTTDYAAQAAVGGHYPPFTPASSDSNWQPPSFGGFQVNSNALFGFPGAYSFPGPWDPNSWYGQQSGYAPAYHAYYSYRAPDITVGVGGLGTTSSVQKGLIKPPHGLSNKHQRLWEAQSAENMHLWAALTRAEAEMAAQHNKILQLEADLQSLRSLQEAPSLAAPSQPFKRVRKKKLSSQLNSSCPEGAMSRSRGRKPSNGKISKAAKPDLNNQVETAIKLDETDFVKEEKVNCSLLIDMLKSVDEKSICAELNAELSSSTRGIVRRTDALFKNVPLSENGKNEPVRHCETYFSHSDGNKEIVNGHIKEGDALSLTKPLTTESDREKEAGSDSRTMDTALGIFSDPHMRTIPVDARSSSSFSHAPAVNVSSDNVMHSWGYASGDASDEQDAGQDDDDDKVVNEDEEHDLSENHEVDGTEAENGRTSGGLPHLNGWKDL